MTQITKEAIEAAARAMCEAWHYAKIGTPDGNAEWKGKQAQYRKQAQAAIEAALPFLSPIAGKPDMLRLAVAAVLEADKEFRANMPPEWEGDPLSDEIDGLRRVYSSLISSPGKDGGQEVEAVTMKRPADLARTENGYIINGHYIYALEVAISTLNLKIGQLRPQPASTALVERLTSALQPFADACFNDNGDITVDLSFAKAEDFIKAYFVHRRALSASTSREGER